MEVSRLHTDGAELLDDLLSRRDLLECLEGGSHSKPELTEACGVSRSTVDRGIGTLERAGVVTRGMRGQYELTLFGRIIAREFDRALDRMGQLADVRTFVETLADLPDGPEMDAGLFDEANVHHGDGMGVTTAIEAFRDATELRIVDPPFALVVLGLAPHDGASIADQVGVFLRNGVLAELKTHGAGLFETYTEHGIDLYEIDDGLPFSFALVDRAGDRTLVLILGDGHDGMALVETAGPAALEWGKALYDRVVEGAEAVPPTPRDTVRTRHEPSSP